MIISIISELDVWYIVLNILTAAVPLGTILGVLFRAILKKPKIE